MNRRLKRLTFSGIGVFVAILLVAGFLFWRGWRTDPDAAIVNIGISPDEPRIGDVIQVGVTVELPWHRRLSNRNEVLVPEGLQGLDPEAARPCGIGAGTWRWHVPIRLQAYDFGPYNDVEMRLSITPNRRGENGVVLVILPELTIVSSIKEEDEQGLATAPPLSDSILGVDRSFWKWILLAGGVVLVLAVAGVVLMQRLGIASVLAPEPPKPWVVAESAIDALGERLRTGLEAELFFVELTDIVRRYIEVVYKMRATEQTTPEFLQTIDDRKSILSVDHRLLLADFMTAADMVKFAKAEANQKQMEGVLKKARRFVVEASESMMGRAADVAVPAEAGEDSDAPTNS